MKYTSKEAIEIIQKEFENAPHTIDDMLGNAACNRKIKQFISACRFESLPEKECRDTLFKLFDEYNVSMNNKSEVSELIYRYYK